MEAIDKLRTQFLQQVAKDGPLAFYDAVVTAIDTGEYTCDILLDDLPIYGIRLRAVISTNQSTDVLPEVNSQVVIGKMGDGDYILIACDKITSYRVTVGTSVFTIDATGTLVSKGDETLNKILTGIIDGMLTIAAPKDVPGITALKIRINNLLK